jgi:metal-dependent hydrolase (beta-lactamase superfamily II)
MKFDVNFLPARYGDAIWIEYGEDDDLHRILIDGGTSGTRADILSALESVPEDQRNFELMVVSHIDRDHIEGILSLLEKDELDFSVSDFWFNGWHHLPVPGDEEEELGAVQGERLTAAILKHGLEWNKAFGEQAVVIPESGDLPVVNLPGGMKITLVSPLIRNLEKLRPKWEKEVKDEGLVPGFGLEVPEPAEEEEEHLGALPDVDELNDEDFHEDDSVANGSSIAFLAEFAGRSVLFAADAYPGVVLESLNKIFDGRATIDLIKLSHHASAHNTSPDLLEKSDSNRYLISTNGSRFHHPAAVTVSRVIKRGGDQVELLFNYRSDDNEVWDSSTLKDKHGYQTTYPGGEGIVVSLL